MLIYKKLTILIILISGLLLNGCSTAPLPSVPEISHTTIVKPQVAVKRPIPRQRAVVTKYRPPLKIYSAVTPTKTVVITKEEQIKQAQEKATVKADPYANIPENNSKTAATITTPETSSAVKSLITHARSQLTIGNTKSAVSSLERGLRIEPENPTLWYLIAKAHYEQSSYQQAISMSKKSIRYSSSDKLTAKNWSLIKEAGEKSGDSVAIREATDYLKINP